MNSSVLLTPNAVDYEHSGFYEQMNRTREVGHSIEEVDLILQHPGKCQAGFQHSSTTKENHCKFATQKKMQIFCRDMRQPLLEKKSKKCVREMESGLLSCVPIDHGYNTRSKLMD